MIDNFKELFTNYPLELVVLLLIFLSLLWWYMRMRINKTLGVIEEQKGRINFLEKELEACRKLKVAVTESGSSFGNQVESKNDNQTNISEEKPQRKDDLKIVEGIGPKIEGLLFEAGIFTFDQLSITEVSKIKKILDKAGSRYQMHDPTTWPDQAALARDDKWDELKKWQAELHKGRLS